MYVAENDIIIFFSFKSEPAVTQTSSTLVCPVYDTSARAVLCCCCYSLVHLPLSLVVTLCLCQCLCICVLKSCHIQSALLFQHYIFYFFCILAHQSKIALNSTLFLSTYLCYCAYLLRKLKTTAVNGHCSSVVRVAYLHERERFWFVIFFFFSSAAADDVGQRELATYRLIIFDYGVGREINNRLGFVYLLFGCFFFYAGKNQILAHIYFLFCFYFFLFVVIIIIVVVVRFTRFVYQYACDILVFISQPPG